MNSFGLANVIKNTTRINIFNSDNNNVANIKTQHHQIKATIVNKILKFGSIIKNPKVANIHSLLLLLLAGSVLSLKTVLS